MIKSIHLHNFETHKDTKLNFSDGVNVIVGLSDTGKSSIIRALYWVFWNRPSGDSFRSFSGGDVRVEVELENCTITRVKTKTKNQYWIDDLKLRAIGTDVPDEVKKLLTIDPINVQRQLDSHFLLSDSPGKVAEHFNRVAQLDVLDLSRKNVESWLRELKSDISHNEKLIDEYQEEEKKYEYLPKLEAEVEVLEKIEQELVYTVRKAKELDQLIVDIKSTEDSIEKVEDRIPPDDVIEGVTGKYEEWKKLNAQVIDLKATIQQYTNCVERARDVQAEIAELELEFEENMPEICPLCEAPKDWYNQ
jgi:DNA repair protein SbcC/Rad50